MFTVVWPLLPLVCFCFDVAKARADLVRLLRFTRRCDPRVGTAAARDWHNVRKLCFALSIVTVPGLICYSTGQLEAFQGCRTEKTASLIL